MTTRAMYETVMGEQAFACLPSAVQRLHRLRGVHVLEGWVETDAPATFLGRVLAWALGSPQQARAGPLRFELAAEPALETWTRCFPTRTMRSQLRLNDAGQIEERLGASLLTFRLTAQAQRMLRMELVRFRFCGVPCPRWLMPRIVAEETGEGDRFHFRVAAVVPGIGAVVGYRGHLVIQPEGRES